jgi:GNAT superfamily N-acetyltransferase
MAAFLALPRAVYRGDPRFVPAGARTERAALERHAIAGGQRLLVAVAGETPLARLAARPAAALHDAGGRPYGLFGFYESLPSAAGREATHRLFAAAAADLRRQGCGPIIGPMDGDTWHRYRLNLGPFDEPPFLMEPHNPPHYAALWEEAGFRPLAEYLSLRVDDPAALLGALCGARPPLPSGYRLRRLSRLRFRRDLDHLYELSRRSFREAFLYTEISRSEFHALYRGARFLIDPDLVWFAESAGQPVAFLFAMPDRQRALVELRRRRGPAALLAFLRHRRSRTVNVKTLAVLPEHRRAGIARGLLREVYGRAIAKGYDAANHCLIREGNPSERLDMGLGRTLRRYRLYRLEAAA